MKIAIAADEKDHIASHTGRCPGFAIYEINDGKASRAEFRANTFAGEKHCPDHSSQHVNQPHQPHLHDTLVALLSDCDVLIARGIGQRLLYDLQANGKEAFICEIDDANEAAREFAGGRLRPAPGSGPCREP